MKGEIFVMVQITLIRLLIFLNMHKATSLKPWKKDANGGGGLDDDVVCFPWGVLLHFLTAAPPPLHVPNEDTTLFNFANFSASLYISPQSFPAHMWSHIQRVHVSDRACTHARVPPRKLVIFLAPFTLHVAYKGVGVNFKVHFIASAGVCACVLPLCLCFRYDLHDDKYWC